MRTALKGVDSARGAAHSAHHYDGRVRREVMRLGR